mgnify:FL=1|tara:strand:- start:3934 stop:4185 length:252 start_codon:yes stop_codon:yes gene_type:complete
MATYKKWQNSELEFIKQNKDSMSDVELAGKLTQMSNSNVTTSMIRRQRRKLGIVKPKGRRKQFIAISDSQGIPTSQNNPNLDP